MDSHGTVRCTYVCVYHTMLMSSCMLTKCLKTNTVLGSRCPIKNVYTQQDELHGKVQRNIASVLGINEKKEVDYIASHRRAAKIWNQPF